MIYQIVLSSSEYRYEINDRTQLVTLQIPKRLIRDTLPDRIVDVVLICERDEDNTETLEAWDLDGSPTRYIRGQREDKAPDCETCKDRKTCKDAPIPPIYTCLGYRPVEEST